MRLNNWRLWALILSVLLFFTPVILVVGAWLQLTPWPWSWPWPWP